MMWIMCVFLTRPLHLLALYASLTGGWLATGSSYGSVPEPAVAVPVLQVRPTRASPQRRQPPGKNPNETATETPARWPRHMNPQRPPTPRKLPAATTTTRTCTSTHMPRVAPAPYVPRQPPASSHCGAGCVLGDFVGEMAACTAPRRASSTAAPSGPPPLPRRLKPSPSSFGVLCSSTGASRPCRGDYSPPRPSRPIS